MNYFSLFGLPIEYKVNTKILISRFQDLQRQWHPDKFSAGSQKEKLIAVKRSAMINQAWQTLRNPISRAEYILSLRGFDFTKKSQSSNVMNDAFFLTEQLKLREEMEDIEKNKDQVRLEALIQRVQETFDVFCQKIEIELDNQSWSSAENIIYKLRFLDGLRRSLERLEEKICD